MTALVDTNVLVRHLTGDPPAAAASATRLLGSAKDLLMPDLILAEVVYVLESFYEAPRAQVAECARSILGFEPIRVDDPALLMRAVEVYETDRIDFAEAYLVATAEATGIDTVVSFDKSIDRIESVERVDPGKVK
ncbi:MAG: VapC toxin family PIN domain ribonuclease [Acidobacteria bacterium]|nr:MAG: VapC toxin family PIN domain ribonuclease [Acidobacteriota bacterium]